MSYRRLFDIFTAWGCLAVAVGLAFEGSVPGVIIFATMSAWQFIILYWPEVDLQDTPWWADNQF